MIRRARKIVPWVAGLLLLLALAFVDWRPARTDRGPRLASQRVSQAPLLAGAAKLATLPELPATVAGYPPRRPEANEAGPLFARALVLEAGEVRIGLLVIETLLVPESLREAVAQAVSDRGYDAVVVAATHTHSSFGGYHDNLVVEIAGTGRYDGARFDWLVERLDAALRQAEDALGPVTLRTGRSQLEGASRNRALKDGPIDPDVHLLELEGAVGPVARLFTFGAHPTLVPRRGTRLDGDYPSYAMQLLEQDGAVALFAQGAGGDVRATPKGLALPPTEAMGTLLAQAVERTATEPQGSGLAFAEVEVDLPRASLDALVPRLLRTPAANLMTLFTPASATVAALRIGTTTLLFIPGEPTVEAARQLATAAGGEVTLVSLAQGYIGYVETPEKVRAGIGEARRTYFEPELLERLKAGARLAAESVRR